MNLPFTHSGVDECWPTNKQGESLCCSDCLARSCYGWLSDNSWGCCSRNRPAAADILFAGQTVGTSCMAREAIARFYSLKSTDPFDRAIAPFKVRWISVEIPIDFGKRGDFLFKFSTILTTVCCHNCPLLRTRILLLAPCPKFGGHFNRSTSWSFSILGGISADFSKLAKLSHN